ncbi:MAG: 4-alpha-glucanotransferase [Muribaculaceae bacterium]
MKIAITLNYRTHWGESVYLTGNCASLGSNDENKALRMSPEYGDMWIAEFDVESNDGLEYQFLIKTDDGNVLRREWGKAHTLNFETSATKLYVYDAWKDLPDEAPFYSTAFTKGIFNHKTDEKKVVVEPNGVVISVYAPMVSPEMAVAITGETKELGSWDIHSAKVMNCTDFPKWTIALPNAENDFEYKFVILNQKMRTFVAWENGRNRLTENESITDGVVVYNSLYINNPLSQWKGAGTAIPVFSLRSEDDYGVGDFYDLFKLIDWAESTKQRIIQILPINDTTMSRTWQDSYPYNANSAFALHPMYLRPDAIAELQDEKLLGWFKEKAKMLNAKPEVDYAEATKLKEDYAKALFAQVGKKTVASVAFRTFVKNNADWLKPYAAYCVLRDMHKTANYRSWGEYAVYDEAKIENFLSENQETANFVYFVQYHLDKQLREVRNYAHKHNVVLKGDIPIGISPDSVDAWVDPRLYNMDCQAGAPPDDFSVLGQNWGFPTYNWEVMQQDGYRWWKRRFAKMAEYFDAYRIDHILGFFRIWQIPTDSVHGLLGTFYPALPLTSDEMRDNYGFYMNRERFTQPYIHDYFVGEYFGEYTEEAKERFLYAIGDGRYEVQDFVNTQKKVLDYFGQFAEDEKNNKLKDGLMKALDDVLFIVDRYDSNKFHPRISAYQTHVYAWLNDYEKGCFNRLYEDFFYHRHNIFWQDNAMMKLPAITQSTDMLVCGEDLGMIPACVENVMNWQRYLSLEIPRMPKETGVEFGRTAEYPYLSVSTTSTHDMSGVRGWWEENPAATQRYYNNELHLEGTAPQVATPDICRMMLEDCLKSPSVLCILPLQDWMSMDGSIRRANPKEEQINIPANSRHYWRYRMHLTLEDLMANTKFSELVKECIEGSGR